jgi:hypothetical protein
VRAAGVLAKGRMFDMPDLHNSLAAKSVESKMATMHHKMFCVREFIKTESVTAVQRAFLLRFNIQAPTRRCICRWNQLKQAVCVKAKAPTDHVYHVYRVLPSTDAAARLCARRAL